jgi:hypothetical protein
MKVAIVSGDDFAADDDVRLDPALAAQGHDVTAGVMHCRTTESTLVLALSPGHRAEIVSAAAGSTVSGWIAPWPVYGRRCRA